MKDRYALFGHPVAHSRSPAIYDRFADATRKRFEFELVDCPPGALADTLRRFGREGGRGGNVTLPHKLAVHDLADVLSERARQAGAVNCFRFETDGILFGDNTDGPGLVADLTRNMGLNLAGKRILVIGAGGATRGILGPLLALKPAEVVVANRDAGKARILAARFSARGRVEGTGLAEAGKAYDLVINATSAPLSGQVPAVDPTVFAPGAIAYDLCYGPDGRTAFTDWARRHGAGAAVDGWGMLVEQAAESFQVWFGVRPETDTVLTRSSD